MTIGQRLLRSAIRVADFMIRLDQDDDAAAPWEAMVLAGLIWTCVVAICLASRCGGSP